MRVTALLPLFGLTFAQPFLNISPLLMSRSAGETAASMLLEIAPTSASCSNAVFPSECSTNEQAAQYLIDGMARYGIWSPTELAALLSLIAYESGDFKYNTNHYPAPGRPGQGTRNMQMASFNLQYALSIPALKSAALAVAPSSSIVGLSDDRLNQIRALVLPDEYSWASAAWFYTTQCGGVRSQVKAGDQAGYEAYLTCVGTSATSERLAYWNRANTALGL